MRFDGFPGSDEVELHLVPMGPLIECLGNKLRPVVHGDPLRTSSETIQTTQHFDHALPGKRCTDLDGDTLT